MEYYSAIKKYNTMAFASIWMKLESIMLSEIRQSQKTKGQMYSLIYSCKHTMWGQGRGDKSSLD